MSFIPCTPGGTLVIGLAADTYEEARRRLMFDAQHMPYPNWKAFKKRGYSIEEVPELESYNPPLWAHYGTVHGHEYASFKP